MAAFVINFYPYDAEAVEAGTRRQVIRQHRKEIDAAGKYPSNWYDAACSLLAKLGLLTSQSGAVIRVLGDDADRLARGYKYGHGWVREILPDDVRAFVASLPASPDVPAWV